MKTEAVQITLFDLNSEQFGFKFELLPPPDNDEDIDENQPCIMALSMIMDMFEGHQDEEDTAVSVH